MQEQREFYRHHFPVGRAVSVEVRSSSGIVRGKAVDLSIAGVAIRLCGTTLIRPEGLIELVISLEPDAEPLCVPAEIVAAPRFDKTFFRCHFRPASDVHLQARIEHRLSAFLLQAQRECLRSQPHLR
jgi:hypothetical protein